MKTTVRLGLLVAAMGLPGVALAGSVAVAVASNFAKPAQQLAVLYRAQAGAGAPEVSFSGASSGKLFAQIENGAPYDVFLSADSERPEKLEAEGLTVAGTRFTYAEGRLVLWSADPQLQGRDCREALVRRRFRHLAVANPKTAPYGSAAMAVLAGLGVRDLGDALVQGENIAQTLQFVATGSAELGFVALSQLRDGEAPAGACRWEVPATMHPPIAQQAVLLRRGAGNAGAAAFLEFLRGDTARRFIREQGYGVAP